jgi:branched-subunit amino acid ABC-type transport system permease component
VSSLLPFIVVGVVTGSLYGLAGVGLVLTYRTSGVFNFGHGALAAAAAFVFYDLHIRHGWPWPVAALVVLGLFAAVGVFVMEPLTRAVMNAPASLIVTLTVGLFLAVDGLLLVVFGDVTRDFPPFLPQSGFVLDGVMINWGEVISSGLVLVLSLGLYLFLRLHRLGVAMRGVVDVPHLVGLTGTPPNRVRAAAWCLGSVFAALSGILLAPTLGLDATLLTLLVIQAFGACAIGLFSSLPLTYAGGIVVGVVASVATKYATHGPLGGLPPTIPFLVMIAVLLIVPARRLPSGPALVRGIAQQSRPINRQRAALFALPATGLLIALPHLVGAYLPVWTAGLSYLVIFGSLALLMWTSGQTSLCQMAFVAVGSTTMGHLTSNRVPWLLALFLAGLAAVPVGALTVIPAIRVSGIYLALATLGFGVLMQDVIFPSFLMFGGGLTVASTRPRFWFVNGASDTWFFYVCLAVAAVSCAAMVGVQRSRLGRLLRGLSEAPTMLATHGLQVNLTRLMVFCLSAFFAAIGGALMISQFSAASGSAYGPVQSLVLVAVLAICGTRLFRSSALAALLIAVVPGYLTKFSNDQQTLLFGVAAMIASLVLASWSDLNAWVGRVAAESAWRRQTSPLRARVGSYR